MLVRSVHDRGELADLLRRDPALHAYELGDLDDFFWPYTSWYRQDDALALVYHGAGLPTLLAFDRQDRVTALVDLLEGLLPLLPRRFYAHLSAGVDGALAKHFQAEPGGLHLKMALTDVTRLDLTRPAGEVLGPADLPELAALYDVAYRTTGSTSGCSKPASTSAYVATVNWSRWPACMCGPRPTASARWET